MRKLSLTILVTVVLTATALLAQEYPNEYSGRLEAIDVTATKTDISRDKVPFSVFTVDTEEQQKESPHGYYNTVGEMVSGVPGVYVAEFYPWGLSWIQLRGTGHGLNRSIQMVDGLPIYAYQNSTINAHDIAQVDVLLGPSSALYGASAAGGVVNMITRSGYSGMGINLELAYGSRSTVRPHFHFGNAVNLQSGTFKFYFSYTGDYSDGYIMLPVREMLRSYYLTGNRFTDAGIENNNFRYNYLATRLDWENDNHTSLSLSVNYAQRYLNGGLPGYIRLDNADQWLTSFRASTLLGDWGKIKLAMGYQSIEAFSIVPRGVSPAPGSPAWSYQYVVDPTLVQRSVAYGTGNRSQFPIDLQIDIHPIENDIITAGVSYIKGNVEPSYTVSLLPANRGAITALVNWEETQLSFYLQNALSLFNDKLTIIGGLRYDEWKYSNINMLNTPANLVDEARFDTITYRLGAKFNITDYFGIRAAYGTAYYQNPQMMFYSGWNNTTNTYRATSQDLKPEQTAMMEFGLDFNKPDWGTEASVTLYHGNIEDSQYTFSVRDTSGALTGRPGAMFAQSRNMGKVQVKGVELSLRQELIKNLLTFKASATFNNSVIKESNTRGNIGNQLSHAPKYVGSYSLIFTKPDLINASVMYKHTDERWYNDANAETLHYHMRNVDLWNAKIWRDWVLSDKVTMTTSLVGTNLTNLQYEGQYIFLAPGRYFEGLLSFTYHFD
ncbi:MAG: TonB-dependent receptor [Deltaproteobacteria bacterium]|jgi:iron complex outermembrane receptor protein|nr:TonB-dependent receptor [Deltaproteobacteria bacterium]